MTPMAPMTLMDKLNAYEKLMRLDKPIGILLLLWPALWGLWFAAPRMQRLDILLIFIMGTILMRSAGCVINDYADRDIDPHVKRTKVRPLAAGLVSPKEALILAAVLLLLSFILVLFLNKLTIALSFVALGLVCQICSFAYLTTIIFVGAKLADAFRRRRRLSAGMSSGVGAMFIGFGAKLATATLG